MFTLKHCIRKSFTSIKIHKRTLCKQFDKSDNYLDYSDEQGLSSEERDKVLATLSKSTSEDLLQYKISRNRVKEILAWREKQGPFKSFQEVLEVKGIKENILEEICTNIIHGPKKNTANSKWSKYLKQLLVPDLSTTTSLNLKTAVAVHLDPTGIGWAKINKDRNTLSEWKCRCFRTLPTKMSPSDTFQLAVDIAKTTPSGDVYIFEAPPNLSPQSQTKPSLISTHHQHVELQAMLLALLNTSITHNQALQDKSNETRRGNKIFENRVFYLKNKVASRLFNTLIGYERVSAISTITGMLKGDSAILRTLPCSHVVFDDKLNQKFFAESSTDKELLSQAFMLIVTFMDLFVYKNKFCFEALLPRSRNKKNQLIKPDVLA